MPTHRLKLIFIALIIFLTIFPGGARAYYFPLGEGARSIALGGAGGALPEGGTALFYDPAALSFLEEGELSYSYLGMNSNSYNFGQFATKLTDEIGFAAGPFLADTQIYAAALSLKLFPSLSIGSTVQLVQNSSDQTGPSGTAINASVLWVIPPTPALLNCQRLSLTVHNLNTSYTFFNGTQPVPAYERLGLSFSWLSSKVTGAFDGLLLNSNFCPTGGLEFDLGSLALGVGAANYPDNQFISAGLTLKNFNHGDWSYAYVHHSILNSMHLFTVCLGLGQAGAGPAELSPALQKLVTQYHAEASKFYQEGKFRQAIDRWNDVLHLDPSDNVAKKSIEKASQERSDLIQKHYQEADTSYRDENYKKAINAWQAILDLQPDEDKASKMMAEANQKVYDLFKQGLDANAQGDYLKACDLWSKVLDHYPGYSDTSERIAKARDKMKESQQKKDYGDKVFKTGKDLFDQGKWTESLDPLHQALEIDPNNAEAKELVRKIAQQFFDKANEFLAKKEMQNAIDNFQHALDADPTMEEARLALVKTQTDYNDKVQSHYLKGINFYNESNYADAVKEWEEALQYDPMNNLIKQYLVKATVGLGIYYYRENKLEEAEASWRKSCSLDPDNQKAALFLKRVQNKIKNLKVMGVSPG